MIWLSKRTRERHMLINELWVENGVLRERLAATQRRLTVLEIEALRTELGDDADPAVVISRLLDRLEAPAAGGDPVAGVTG